MHHRDIWNKKKTPWKIHIKTKTKMEKTVMQLAWLIRKCTTWINWNCVLSKAVVVCSHLYIVARKRTVCSWLILLKILRPISEHVLTILLFTKYFLWIKPLHGQRVQRIRINFACNLNKTKDYTENSFAEKKWKSASHNKRFFKEFTTL